MIDFFNKKAWLKIFSHLKNKKLLTMFLLGFSAGLPLLLVFTTLSAWLRDENIVRSTIGFFGWVTIFYGLKFLWAPLIDSIKLPLIHNILGKRRSWLLLTQISIGIFLYLLATISPNSESLITFAICALFVSFFSASQDIVVDGYRVDILKPNERGIGSSIQLLGYRLGMLVSGSLALIAASKFGWKFSYFSMAVVMFVLMCSSLCIPEPCRNVNIEKVSWRSYLLPYRSMIAKKDVWIVVMFVLLYKLSDNLVFNLNMFFLLKVIHFKLSTVGYVSNVVSMVGLLLGSVIAGVIMYRISLYRALMIFGWFQLLSNLGYVWIAVSGKKIVVMAIGLFLEKKGMMN